MALIEIDGLPIKNTVIFHGYVSHNQRVNNLENSSVISTGHQMAVCQNLVPLVNIKIAGKWMFIPLKMVLIGIDPYP